MKLVYSVNGVVKFSSDLIIEPGAEIKLLPSDEVPNTTTTINSTSSVSNTNSNILATNAAVNAAAANTSLEKILNTVPVDTALDLAETAAVALKPEYALYTKLAKPLLKQILKTDINITELLPLITLIKQTKDANSIVKSEKVETSTNITDAAQSTSTTKDYIESLAKFHVEDDFSAHVSFSKADKLVVAPELINVTLEKSGLSYTIDLVKIPSDATLFNYCFSEKTGKVYSYKDWTPHLTGRVDSRYYNNDDRRKSGETVDCSKIEDCLIITVLQKYVGQTVSDVYAVSKVCRLKF